MLHLALPHVNVITKMDLLPSGIEEEDEFEKYFNTNIPSIVDHIKRTTPSKFHPQLAAISQLVHDYDMIGFHPLNIQDEESVDYILSHVDHCIQYGEDEEPREPKDKEWD
eukprot:TRINITY_DN3712_c0_g1_i2.p1 TRINITY_DN3712_c0_g1~~TRINITY_DN3712_c0_g1_i2.p1  ORF type:complete len:110 (-),score=26.91 TRINITY_DN3712_c0_g1_i2:172-501(-)